MFYLVEGYFVDYCFVVGFVGRQSGGVLFLLGGVSGWLFVWQFD